LLLFVAPELSPDRLCRLEDLAAASGFTIRAVDAIVDGRRAFVLEPARPGETGNGRPDPDLLARIRLWPGVERLVSFADLHPKCRAAPESIGVATRSRARDDSEHEVRVGGEHFLWIAGPCSVDNPDFLGQVAQAAKRAGASMLRGGAFKPRTSPYSFRGLGREGLTLLSAVATDVGLPLVTEVLDTRDVEFVAQHADMLQLGARNMQNFALLRVAGAAGLPILLKRGPAASVDELLHAAEHVLDAGCPGLVLCERGIKNLDPSRGLVLDLNVVLELRERTQMPVIVDPSHGSGKRSFVIPLARAAAAVGADGVMVEVHPCPAEALSDGAQALLPEDLVGLGGRLRELLALDGRTIARAEGSAAFEPRSGASWCSRSRGRSSQQDEGGPPEGSMKENQDRERQA